MTYRFRDRAKEWTSWVGVALTALATVLPQVVPPDTWWVEAWQAAQTGLGMALVFIPHTAGTTAIENDAWSLLKAFAAQLPPAYATPMQPFIQALASGLAHAETQPSPAGPGNVVVPAPTPVPAQPTPMPVPAQPVPATPQPVIVSPEPAPRPQPKPLVADPAAALHPLV